MPQIPPSPFRRGHCPSAGTPMESGDGLLSRVNLLGGRLDAGQLINLADWAEELGAPTLEITSRGKLQVRGFSAQSELLFTRKLVAAGLARETAAAEAARHVICSVAADIDPKALHDPYAIAQQLDTQLSTTPALWQLPSKFLICIDGGGGDLAYKNADIRVDAISSAKGIAYRIALAGSRQSSVLLGYCQVQHCVDAIVILAKEFLSINEQRKDKATRIKQLLNDDTLALFKAIVRDMLIEAQLTNTEPTSTKLLGQQAGWFGFAPPFGVMSSDTTRGLARLAAAHGHNEFRVSPEKVILIPGGRSDLSAPLKALGMIVTDSDSRLSLVACPGAPACLSGSTATRSLALTLVEHIPDLFDGELRTHFSGCPKGCANPQASPITIVAQQGKFDVIVKDRATPLNENRRVAQNLSTEELVMRLSTLSNTLEQARRDDESLSDCIARLDIEQLKIDLNT
ncbi:MAG: precorrin-3B synthase [Zhongshania sp.]|jgi:precorrin-3B synthase|nr:precorrin-3B synthase [Zhongshania sp.]